MGRNNQKEVKVPSGWWGRLHTFCKRKWEHDAQPEDVFDICAFTRISRRTFSTARQRDAFKEATFATLVDQVGCESPDDLLRVLGDRSLETNSSHVELSQTIDRKLLGDYSTGVGFAEWFGSRSEFDAAVRNGRQWLTAHPEDFYCRGMFLWSILNNGTPVEIVNILKETGRWLISEPPKHTILKADSKAWELKFQEKLKELKSEKVEHLDFVRWHIEDTLCRAGLMRYLRFFGSKSKLATEFTCLGDQLEKQTVLKPLFATNTVQPNQDWIQEAVKYVSLWADRERESGLPRLLLLWFTGRKRDSVEMQLAIDQSCRWLSRNPDHVFVRWATIWLGGVSPDGELVGRLIDESGEWLKTAPDDERLVRMVFLWLVSYRGSNAQVREAISQTSKWLKEHEADDFIRIPYLFLIRRKGSPEERLQALTEARDWLQRHSDLQKLTESAVLLCESTAFK